MSAAVAPETPQRSLFAPQDESQPFEVHESDRARRLSVRVYPGGRVRVTVPRGTRPDHVAGFVSRHRAWIDRKVAQWSERGDPTRDPLPERVALAATGREWQVLYLPGTRALARARGGDELEVRSDPTHPGAARAALRAWLVEEARLALEPWIRDVARQGGFGFERVQLRRQRTRWGSCSRSGTISLNISLMFQPPEVVRYLFIHELCHTRHMNHSDRFWRLVATHEPDFARLDRALSKGWRNVPGWVYAEERP